MNRKAEKVENQESTVVEVGGVAFGRDRFPVIAGPCAIESGDQIMELAKVVKDAGAKVLRGGISMPQQSPYDFPGLGSAAVSLLVEAGESVGLPVVTQVHEPKDVENLAGKVDMLEIASGNMQNFELLRVVGAAQQPVLLKRAPSATIDEWLWAAEYVLAEGNDRVILCERGIRTFAEGPTLDLSSVPIMKETTHLPVIVLPSHAAGMRSRVSALALAAQGVGADGLAIEVHADPANAKANSEQLLGVEAFSDLMISLGVNLMRGDVDEIDLAIVELLSQRQNLAVEIGRIKVDKGMPLRSPEREAELLDDVRRAAGENGLDSTIVASIFELVLEGSRAAQRADQAARGQTPE